MLFGAGGQAGECGVGSWECGTLNGPTRIFLEDGFDVGDEAACEIPKSKTQSPKKPQTPSSKGEGAVVIAGIFDISSAPRGLLKEDPTARRLRKCHRAATNESIRSCRGTGTSRRLVRRR